MKKLILVVMLIFCLPTLAQNSAFELLSFCRDSNAYYLALNLSADVYQIQIMPSHSAILEHGVTYAGIQSFTIPLENEWLEIRASIPESQPVQMLYFGTVRDCEGSEALPTAPRMNECLGFNPESLGLPNQGVFRVDHNEYSYNGNLSFLVPIDSYWLWQFSAYGLIFSFEQSASNPCHIVEGD